MRSNPVKTYFILACLLITALLRTSAQTAPAVKPDTITKTVPKPLLDDKVDYTADDSMITDITNQKAYLYNHASVVYQDMTLKAGYIEIDFKNNTVYAYGVKDSTGKEVQRPDFKNKDGQYVAGFIAYNFDTKKGKIKDVITQQDEGFIHGSDIKKDTGDVYYVKDGKYTTCDLDHPHYYIGAKKIKVIPEDKIITGPAELWIADIPTPLVLPFGYFPNKKGRRSGILMPSYGESVNWGFFLKDGGFYFGGNEYMDLALTGDIYSNGSYGARAATNYRKRYRFDGGLNLSYSRTLNGDVELPNTTVENNFFVRWRHAQDPKAHPSSRFSADVNAGSSRYNKFNGSVTGDYLQSNFMSNISYSKTFTGTPFNFAANARHNQNTITKKMDITLPELTFSMNRINPFKNKQRVTNKWYDKIGISATANARNEISAYDSTLFTDQTLQQMRNGVRLSVPISTSFNVLKYFTVTPLINTSSTMYFKTIEKHLDAETNTIITDTVPGTVFANEFGLSASVNTRLYGDYYFRTKRLKQIRHVAVPQLTASYRPDFSETKYGYYKTFAADTISYKPTQYSIFQNGVFGSPAAGRSGTLNFSLNNTIEAKRKTESDSGSVFKKVSLIDNFGVSFAYNMAVVKRNWSNINFTGRTRLFKALDINASTTLNPYQIDTAGVELERFEWNNGRLGRLVNSYVTLSTSLHPKTKQGAKPVSNNATQDQMDYINSHPEAYVDFNIPWNLSVFYTINYSRPDLASSEITTQSLSFNGDVSLTKKWKVSLSSGYDFTSKKMTLTSINIYRDLHCWEMRFNWVPFGFRQSFSIDINVKASVLKDLKLSRRKDWQDYQ
ncbi:MAG: hypothetical protein K0Q95_2938 [Bacteroidota bacterium]|nr:hypothetical protein [Bacteroidota bacterium]